MENKVSRILNTLKYLHDKKTQFILKTVHPETKKEYLLINQFKITKKKFTNIKEGFKKFYLWVKNWFKWVKTFKYKFIKLEELVKKIKLIENKKSNLENAQNFYYPFFNSIGLFEILNYLNIK